jgi:hypothetical protein
MSYYAGTVTYGSTGLKTLNIGFQPERINITVCQKFNTNDGYHHLSVGRADGTRQSVNSTFQDTAGGISINSTSKCVSHYERLAGVITEVLAANFDSFTATGFKLNVTTANANYQLFIEAQS